MNGYGAQNVDQLLSEAVRLAKEAKRAGIPYQQGWLAAWPGGVAPIIGQNDQVLDQVIALAQKVKAAVSNEEANRLRLRGGITVGSSSSDNDLLDERGLPGYNMGYQYWVRAWPEGSDSSNGGNGGYGAGRRGSGNFGAGNRGSGNYDGVSAGCAWHGKTKGLAGLGAGAGRPSSRRNSRNGRRNSMDYGNF